MTIRIYGTGDPTTPAVDVCSVSFEPCVGTLERLNLANRGLPRHMRGPTDGSTKCRVQRRPRTSLARQSGPMRRKAACFVIMRTLRATPAQAGQPTSNAGPPNTLNTYGSRLAAMGPPQGDLRRQSVRRSPAQALRSVFACSVCCVCWYSDADACDWSSQKHMCM